MREGFGGTDGVCGMCIPSLTSSCIPISCMYPVIMYPIIIATDLRWQRYVCKWLYWYCTFTEDVLYMRTGWLATQCEVPDGTKVFLRRRYRTVGGTVLLQWHVCTEQAVEDD